MSETKSGAPERVWLRRYEGNQYYEIPAAWGYATSNPEVVEPGYAEYVRGDIAGWLAAALKNLEGTCAKFGAHATHQEIAIAMDNAVAALTRYRSASPSTQENEGV